MSRPMYLFLFIEKGWDGSVKGSGFTLGITASGNYTGLKNSAPDNGNAASNTMYTISCYSQFSHQQDDVSQLFCAGPAGTV